MPGAGTSTRTSARKALIDHLASAVLHAWGEVLIGESHVVEVRVLARFLPQAQLQEYGQ